MSQHINNFFQALKTRGISKTLIAIYYHLMSLLYTMLSIKFYKKKIYNYEMYLDLNDKGISRTLMLFAERELEHKKIIEMVLKPGMNVLDIGANIGYYAIMQLKIIGDTGKLIAVEPSKSNIQLLKKNLNLNGFNKVEIHNKAVSNITGKRKLYLSDMSNLNTFHKPTHSNNLYLSGKTLEVETITVEKLVNKKFDLNLIRMDVEGHEVEILDGMIPFIKKSKSKPMIVFETHLSRYSKNHNFENTLKNLFKLGYHFKIVGSSSKRGTKLIEQKGYASKEIIKSDDEERAIFLNISNSDAIDLVCYKGGIRTALLSKD